MKKKHKILISMGIALVVVAIAGGFQVNKTIATDKQRQQLQADKIASEKLEKQYNQVVKTIKETDWSKAKDSDWESIKNKLNEVSGFKNEPNYLFTYILALKYYYTKDIITTYYTLKAIPIDYSGDLNEDIKNFRGKIKSKVLEDYKTLLEKKDYQGAIKLVSDEDDKEFNDLNLYASALKYKNDNEYESFIYCLAKITNPYTGFMKEEIQRIIDSNAEEVNKERVHQNQINNYVPLKTPAIGMTAQEVLDSRWGKPTKVNRTTTANGVSEQWVYGSSRYVYLEDGVVTAIQD